MVWRQCVLGEDIEGEFGLGGELVLKVFGKDGFDAGEDGKEVALEGVDGFLKVFW